MYSKTQFPEFESDYKINPERSIYTCGSCFADELNKKLKLAKFDICQHPFGIVFNPVSISRQFTLILENYTFRFEDLVYHNGLYHSMDHHGMFSHPDPDVVLNTINADLQKANRIIPQLSSLIITLGSAHHYVFSRTQQTVANCHKLPQDQFFKKRASAEEIIIHLEELITKLRAVNPKLHLVFSVSPVRYLKDGFIENAVSKASLMVAIDFLCTKYDQLNYFPAYEIFMDDLRDYRYVADDLVHPNTIAIDYIWKYFENAFFDERTRKRVHDLVRLNKMLQHCMLHPHSEEYKKFILNLTEELDRLEGLYPGLDWKTEKDKIKGWSV
jgi:hypothetical protein